MLDAISMAQVAMDQDQLKLEMSSHNVSNMGTPAYKKAIVAGSGFDEHLAANMEGVAMQMKRLNSFEQGTFNQTHRPLDIAISGAGFIEVQTNEGVRYTRRGDLRINDHGELTTAMGDIVLGAHGSIRVDSDDFVLDKQGNLLVDSQKVDQLKVVQFDDINSLQYVGRGLFRAQGASRAPDASVQVLQGFIEQSNVKSVDEMMDLMRISRHFESNQRVLRMADTMMATAINQLGDSNV